jgi:Xaa-Pro aminopeptidase
VSTMSDAAFRQKLPFDSAKLDQLLAQAGIDVMMVTSKHNIHYLLGGYRFFFHDQSDAIGVSRYLPILIYPRGRPQEASYVGHVAESFEVQNGRFWMSKTDTKVTSSIGAMRIALEHLQQLRENGVEGRIGMEFAFMPADAADLLRAHHASDTVVDGHFPLERLRSIKTSHELELVKQASERVVDAMMETFSTLKPGMTKNDVVASLRRNEVKRGLTFEYCAIAAGGVLNRAPTDQVLKTGDIVNLDSGGCYQGYLGDLARMGIIGPPDAELEELLGEIETFQQTARQVVRAGATGADIFAMADPLIERSAHRAVLEFEAHGLGLVNHEAPRLNGRGAITYEAYDRDRPLEPGMVVSVETAIKHPRRGLIKLEDTLAVTAQGAIAYGDFGRGWNQPSEIEH